MVYLLILMAIGLSLNATIGEIAWLNSPIIMDGVAFLTVVMPVILYFSLQESSDRQATWGKSRVRIKVVNKDGAKLTFWQAFLRACVKFVPWQIAHTSIIWISYVEPAPILLAGSIMAQILVFIYALFIGLGKGHRAPYDWLLAQW